MPIVLTCVSVDPLVRDRAARFTTGYVRLVGQEPAPSWCVLMEVRPESYGKKTCGVGL